MMNIYEEAKKITDRQNIDNIYDKIRSEGGINKLIEANAPVQQGSGQPAGDNPQNKTQKPVNNTKANPNNPAATQLDPLEAGVKSFLEKNPNKCLLGIFISSRAGEQRRLIQNSWYLDDNGEIKSIIANIDHQKVVDINTLSLKSIKCTDPNIIKLFKEYKLSDPYVSEIKIIEELRSKGYIDAEKGNLDALKKLQKKFQEKEGIIYEHLDRLYQDMIATKGSNRLGSFNAG